MKELRLTHESWSTTAHTFLKITCKNVISLVPIFITSSIIKVTSQTWTKCSVVLTFSRLLEEKKTSAPNPFTRTRLRLKSRMVHLTPWSKGGQ